MWEVSAIQFKSGYDPSNNFVEYYDLTAQYRYGQSGANTLWPNNYEYYLTVTPRGAQGPAGAYASIGLQGIQGSQGVSVLPLTWEFDTSVTTSGGSSSLSTGHWGWNFTGNLFTNKQGQIYVSSTDYYGVPFTTSGLQVGNILSISLPGGGAGKFLIQASFNSYAASRQLNVTYLGGSLTNVSQFSNGDINGYYFGESVQGIQGPDGSLFVAKEYTITVPAGTSNGFYIDGVQRGTIYLIKGQKYRFNNSLHATHPFALSTTSDGTHGGGSAYTTGWTAGTSAEFIVPLDAPSTLYYYCENHSGMGGELVVKSLTSDALQGTQGLQGAIGNQGIQGSFGAQGPAGTSQGIQGLQGIQGQLGRALSSWTANVTGGVTLSSSQYGTYSASSAGTVISNEGFTPCHFSGKFDSLGTNGTAIGLGNNPTSSVASLSARFEISPGPAVDLYYGGQVVYTDSVPGTSKLYSILYDGLSVKYYVSGILRYTTSSTPSNLLSAGLVKFGAVLPGGGSIKDIAFGASGGSGVQGFAGTSQGIQGDLGLQGIQGTIGPQGTTGTQGTGGTQGNDGLGLQGTGGVQGSAGTSQGVQGISGLGGQGIQGLDGAFASVGAQGAAGSAGGVSFALAVALAAAL